MSTTEPPSLLVQIAETDELFNHVFDIRTRVFVDEVSVDQEDEYDGFDHLSHHYLAWLNGIPVGTARWRLIPATGRIRLERFAVLPAYRGQGVGKALVDTLLQVVPAEGEIFVHPQLDKTGFFARMGFEEEGEPFEEAGILHKKMVYLR